MLGALLAALVVAVWRSAANLESHVQAGSQAVVEALRSFAYAGRTGETQRINEIRSLLHGLGEPVAVRLGPETPSVGRTLAELNLRGRSGATVLAISRGADSIVAPPASERLRAGDLLALAGTDEAIEAARKILTTGVPVARRGAVAQRSRSSAPSMARSRRSPISSISCSEIVNGGPSVITSRAGSTPPG